MAARALQAQVSQTPKSSLDSERRSFWRQTLSAWRAQGDKKYLTEHETASRQRGNPLRNSIESLNSLMSYLSVLEMYIDLEAIIRLAEYTPQPTATLSDGDRELIQLQLLIWASSFNSGLSIWHASQILRHFIDTDVVEAFAASTSCCHQ